MAKIDTTTKVSFLSFIFSVFLFISFQCGLIIHFDRIQSIFHLIGIDLYKLISGIHPLLVYIFACFIYHLISVTIFYCCIRHQFYREIAIRSNLLGSIFSIGLQILIVNFINDYDKHNPVDLTFLEFPYLGIYLCFLSFFHFSEFFIIALTNPNEVKISSFMLNHSFQYHIAVIVCFIEYFFELHYFPNYKLNTISLFIHRFGVICCLVGEVIRKLAIFTANKNFNHIVQLQRKSNHELVTNGIYGVFRHPSYIGWYIFSVGTQLVLVNPICIIGYTIASWLFFNSRIYLEEVSLIEFFGQDYVNYQNKVKIWIPFIKGYKVPSVRLERRES